MRAVTWHGRRDVRTETVPDPTITSPTDAIVRVTSSGLCGSDLHLYEVMAPFMTSRRHPRPRADGNRRSRRGVRHRPRPGRPGGDPVQHRLRPLLHVRSGAAVPVRDDAGARVRVRCSLVRLHQALRAGSRGTGRVAAGPACRLRADQDAPRSAGRPIPVPLRCAADGMASGAVRRCPEGGVARRARPGADRRHVLPGGARTRNRSRDRRRSRRRAARTGEPPRRRDARPDRVRFRSIVGRRRSRAAPTDAGPMR